MTEALIILISTIGIGISAAMIVALVLMERRSRIARKEFEQRFDREVRRE